MPLGPLVAGLSLSLGFHVTFRLWDQTRTYEPLDISPPFAAEPAPGTSLDTLIRRYGPQLPPLLSPKPDRPVPPPPVLTPDVTANGTAGSTPPQPRDANRAPPAAPAVPPATHGRQEDRPAQNQTTVAAPQMPRPALPTSMEPGTTDLTVPSPPPSLGVPQLPPPQATQLLSP
ncbi:MAG: hypothetical protein TE42_06770 [Candidatus Synechococcus spongiarum SP3]|uniref:Uncharacterized protein n=1 Tax=Candidatus Synechococcus spongiarum SP3 TaxID=1604020 RepID=A0A0G2IW26_9SYNE|nr:MAG: hypothetical protein TE42_06770 [Candidatus Synechococcus spongiarum SP3]